MRLLITDMRLKKIDSINIVPFVDVILVLLIMVIMSATFVNKSKIEIDTPSTNNIPADDNKKRVTRAIHITSDNKIFVDNIEIRAEDMDSWVKSNVDLKDNVVIDSDKESSYNSFVKVFSALKKNNIKNVNIYVKRMK